MKRRVAFAAVLVFVIIAGAHTFASGVKLPKCSSVKCRDLGCPADVLCVSGAHVKTCADVCNGR